MADEQETIQWFALTDLDSLFDTRISIIAREDKALAEELLKNREEYYYVREVERFGHITPDQWIELYSKRSKSVLKTAMPTGILRVVTGYMALAEMQQAGSPIPVEPILLVNSYPYELKKEEEEILLKGLVAATKGTINIRMCRLSYAKLTPAWLRENVATYVTYNYREWLETQSMIDSFSKAICPDTVVLAPRTVYSETEEDPFELMTDTFKPLFTLDWAPVRDFSIWIPEVPEEKK